MVFFRWKLPLYVVVTGATGGTGSPFREHLVLSLFTLIYGRSRTMDSAFCRNVVCLWKRFRCIYIIINWNWQKCNIFKNHIGSIFTLSKNQYTSNKIDENLKVSTAIMKRLPLFKKPPLDLKIKYIQRKYYARKVNIFLQLVPVLNGHQAMSLFFNV